MAKNRKNESSSVRFAPAVKAILLCFLLGGSGVGYVGQKNQIYALGEQIKQAEMKMEALKTRNEEWSRRVAELQTPREIETRIRQMNLGLVAPQPDQIVRLTEPMLPGDTRMGSGRPIVGQLANIGLTMPDQR